MIIDCISDLHGHYPELEGGDLLIVAGDLTALDSPNEYYDFFGWLQAQAYSSKIIIGGNHDNFIQKYSEEFLKMTVGSKNIMYLQDSGIKFDNLKIWGSPWTLSFKGMNPHCKAFTVDTEDELMMKWALIPDDVDILITHSPAHGFLDEVKNYQTGKIENVGSKLLSLMLGTLPKLKLFVCGHIHEGYGIIDDNPLPFVIVNASHVNENYESVNKPIRMIL